MEIFLPRQWALTGAGSGLFPEAATGGTTADARAYPRDLPRGADRPLLPTKVGGGGTGGASGSECYLFRDAAQARPKSSELHKLCG